MIQIRVSIDSQMFAELVSGKVVKAKVVSLPESWVSIELALEDIGMPEILDAIDRAFLRAPELVTVAQTDTALVDWLLGVVNSRPVESGGFLRRLAEAALAADAQNYRLMRPIVAEMRRKYPKYSAKAAP